MNKKLAYALGMATLLAAMNASAEQPSLGPLTTITKVEVDTDAAQPSAVFPFIYVSDSTGKPACGGTRPGLVQGSVEQAKTFRERLLASGAIERGGMRLKTGPTVAEVDDATTY